MPRNLAASREAILDAAEVAFADRGYDGASLQQIANAAGVSRGLPSYVFTSKERLYEAVLERAFATPAALASGGGPPGAGDPRVVLASLVGSYLDFLASRPTYVRLLQRAALDDGDRLGRAAAHLGALGQGVDALVRLLDGPGLRPIDPRQLFVSIVALCFFPLAHQSTLLGPLGLDGSDPGFLAARKEHVVDLLLRGLTP